MTKEEIRNDLKDIRYYYSMERLFLSGENVIRAEDVIEKVKHYNAVMSKAPAKLYAVYLGLYVNNNSQAALAEDWGYTERYVRRLSDKLCGYLERSL